jgi:hypothetical protein
MLPFFTLPWALFGLAALPTLAAIYWLRNRYRVVPVSSLMLWAWQQQPRAGGPKVQRLQLPLLFFLELLALLLLVLAAADPSTRFAAGRRPLVVVLDDSFSMIAGHPDSPRQRAADALLRELQGGPRYAVRFVLAGTTPQVLGEPAHNIREVREALVGWHCRAPAARLEEALGLAGQLGGSSALLLVLTDHAPDFPFNKDAEGRLQWHAFGEGRPNLAFVTATRTSQAGEERCLLEVANFSRIVWTGSLVLKTITGAELSRGPLSIAGGATHRLVLALPPDTPPVQAEIDAEDALEIDNRVTLVREESPPVRVQVQVRDVTLRRLLEKALQATGRVTLTATRPDLLCSDEDDTAGDPETWLLRLLIEKEAEAYVGPFVLDHSHPLADGLSLAGVVWGAGKAASLPGTPVVMAGNVPLLTDDERSVGRHELTLRLRPDLSTLQDSPAWPVLLWNLVQWRAAHRPGLARANLRLGETAQLSVAAGVEAVELLPPRETVRTLPVHARRFTVRLEEPGRYEFRAGDHTYAAAANALSREESDLSTAVSGRWGEWADEAGQHLGTESVAWVLLLVAAAVLTLHLFVAARGD